MLNAGLNFSVTLLLNNGQQGKRQWYTAEENNKKKKQSSVKIMWYVDGEGTVFAIKFKLEGELFEKRYPKREFWRRCNGFN